MATSDSQRGAIIATIFAQSQGYDHEGGMPKGSGKITFGPGVIDLSEPTPPPPQVPPLKGPTLPVDDPYRSYRTQQA